MSPQTRYHRPYGYQPKDRSRQFKGLLVVGLVHALLAWAIVSGGAKKAVELVKPPVDTALIQIVTLPPPRPIVTPPLVEPTPPPAKSVRPPAVKAPKLAPLTAPPREPTPFVPPSELAPPEAPAQPPAAIAAPPGPVLTSPSAPAAPAVPATGKKSSGADIGIACPTQVAPQMPRRAIQDGIEGTVKAQALIRDGVVKEVTILSGPRVLHAAVRAAMLQYRCTVEAGDVLAIQDFNFKIE